MNIAFKIPPFLLLCISFFFTGIKESHSQSVHQEFESIDGGGWFASGDYYIHTSISQWFYFLGLPIYRLNCKNNKEFYCEEHSFLEEPITRKVLFEKTILS